MQVSAAEVRRYSDAIGALQDAGTKAIGVRVRLADLERRILDGDEDAPREAASIMADFARTLHEHGSAIACEYYDSLRRQAKPGGTYAATQAEFTDDDESSAYAAGQAIAEDYTEDGQPLAKALGTAASRYAQDSFTRTVRRNCRRDPAKPRFVIVPNPGACAFCQMRASQALRYKSEPAPSHGGCRCAATAVFGNSKIEGYDPDESLALYDEAASTYRSGDISDELKERISAAKAAHAEAYRNGETSKRWDSSNAILMVMREQQGIK